MFLLRDLQGHHVIAAYSISAVLPVNSIAAVAACSATKDDIKANI